MIRLLVSLCRIKISYSCHAWLVILLVGGMAAVASSDDRTVAEVLLRQLEGSRYSERQAAFMKLSDPSLDIESWLDEQSAGNDPQRVAICKWLRRIRSIPGSLDDRLAMMADYQSLVESLSKGDLDAIGLFTNRISTEQLVELLEMMPQSVLSGLAKYQLQHESLDELIDSSWREGKQHLVPRMLNALLPRQGRQSLLRSGINARWREIQMPPSWNLDEPTDEMETEIAGLERDGKIDEAIARAKRDNSNQIESILFRNGRWDDWLALDSDKQLRGKTSQEFHRVERAIVLESLGRHDEAIPIYRDAKQSESDFKLDVEGMQASLLAMVTGDDDWLYERLREKAPEELMGLYFIRNRIDDLLELEGLADKSLSSLDAWLTKVLQEGKPLSKAIRFQSLFKRLGFVDLERRISERVDGFIFGNDFDQQLFLVDGLVNDWAMYGVDEQPRAALEKLVDAWGIQKQKTKIGNRGPGVPRAQQVIGREEREVSIESLFFKTFTLFRSAAYPAFETLRETHPKLSNREVLTVIEDFDEGRIPSGWSRADVQACFRSILRKRNVEPELFESILVDLADALDAMGMTETSLEMLQDSSSSHAANILVAQYAAKLGDLEQAAKLSDALAAAHPDDLNCYVLASRNLAASRRVDAWLTVQQRTLSRLDAWEMYTRYAQTVRRGVRQEPPPEIQFFLEQLQKHHPSTWEGVLMGDVYENYGTFLLGNLYHQFFNKHPERADKLVDLMRSTAIHEIRGLSGSDVGKPNGFWSIDWQRWCWQIERCIGPAFWQAVQRGDLDTADRLVRSAQRMNPEQINTIIDVAELVRKKFGADPLEKWFRIYYDPMMEHLQRYPNDTLIANNAAWLAAKCGFELDTAHRLASQVVEASPTDTYMDTLAEVEFMRGNAARAIEISEKCRAMKPRDPHHRKQIERFRASSTSSK